ncbi:MAG: hypothetical protein LLG20_22635 [Acidobacteriales bacterium]|nr:hypothetical protein [Terriglobales bacterium]
MKGLAKPDETHVVRVIAHEANNSTVYRLRCRTREYRFERDGTVGRHILDIPVSVWMAGAPGGAGGGKFRDNQSIAEDFRTAERCPYSIHVLPIASSTAADAPKSSSGHLPALRRLLSNLGAPDEVRQAFALIDAGGTPEELEKFTDSVITVVMGPGVRAAMIPFDQPDIEESPSQARARKMREAKAAKKAAQLQPA